MKAPLTDVLQDIAGAARTVDPDAVRARGDQISRTARRRRVAIAAFATVIALVVGVSVILRPVDQRVDVGPASPGSSQGTSPNTGPATRATSVITNTAPPPGVLLGDTGVLVIGDDGLGGAVVIDLDHHRVVRRSVPGSSAGDQPHRFDVINGKIITGWGEIWGADVKTAASTKITDGTIYLPGTDDTIWIAAWSEGRIGAGTFSVEQVGVDGAVRQRVVEPKAFPPRDSTGKPYFFPSWGLGPRLLFDSDHGIAAWDPRSDSITWHVGRDGGSGRVLDARAGRALWLADEKEVHVVNEAGVDSVLPVAVPDGAHIGSVRLSPDATRVAVAIATDREADTSTALSIVDLESGQVDRIGNDLVDQKYATGPLQWSPDGTQVFSIGWSYASGTTKIARYVLGHDAWTSETLPFGGVTASAIVTRDEATAWLDAPNTSAAACTPSRVYTPGQATPPCGFSF